MNDILQQGDIPDPFALGDILDEDGVVDSLEIGVDGILIADEIRDIGERAVAQIVCKGAIGSDSVLGAAPGAEKFRER